LRSISAVTRFWVDMKRMPPSSQNEFGMPGACTDSNRPPMRPLPSKTCTRGIDCPGGGSVSRRQPE
jgi:hypothetical protein